MTKKELFLKKMASNQLICADVNCANGCCFYKHSTPLKCDPLIYALRHKLNLDETKQRYAKKELLRIYIERILE